MRPVRGVASSPPLTTSESTPSSGIVNAADSVHRIWRHLLAEADTHLFSRISTNSLHVLYDILPPPSTASQHYSLREGSHHFSLPYRITHLAESNFITRCLFNDAYSLLIDS